MQTFLKNGDPPMGFQMSEFELSQPQRQHNTTQPQHCIWIGHENVCANPAPPTAQHPPPIHHTGL